jgi:dipeptidyl aminopeptidase/acylaminoacyl peptidase
VAVGALLVAAAPAAPADLKPLTFEALRGLVTVREPQISPDGKRIAYVRATGDYKADRTDSELVLLDVASGARRVITHDRIGVHAPRWSPSGDRIAYLASPARSKPAQLYVLPMSGGDSKITDVKAGVEGFDWRPDWGDRARALRSRVTADLRGGRQDADVHHDRRRRPARADAALVRVLSCRARDRHAGGDGRVPSERTLPQRSAPPRRAHASLDRLVREALLR